MEKIKEFVKSIGTNIDEWQTLGADYISFDYNCKNFCVSYGARSSKKYLFSDIDCNFFKMIKSEEKMIEFIKKILDIDENYA